MALQRAMMNDGVKFIFNMRPWRYAPILMLAIAFLMNALHNKRKR